MQRSNNGHPDHLNTPRLVANAAGTTVWRWDQQEPFGVNVPDENPSGLGTFDLPLRLPGQHYDKETNLHYNYFRDYDPSIGRYVESDPVGLLGGLNTYAYVRSNPVRWTDRFGLQTCGSGWNDPIVPDNPVGYPFSGCCKKHDDCYEDCVNRPSQGSCDNAFLSCMLQQCNRRWAAVKYVCDLLAVSYYEFVYWNGSGPFNAARSKCNTPTCDPKRP